MEEGEILEDEFGQFKDSDILGVDTEVFAKGKETGGQPLYSSHPTNEANMTAAERRRAKQQKETAEFMKLQPSKRDSMKPTNIWVLVDVLNGNIEKMKTTMWHDILHEMFEADPEVKILPRSKSSTQSAFGAGDGKIPPMLFPDYVTQQSTRRSKAD